MKMNPRGSQGVALLEKIKRCGLLELVFNWGWVLSLSRAVKLDPEAHYLFLLPAYLDEELSATMSACVLPCSLA